ncbi:MAG: MBL fold metallo-hydrolase [Cyclobacteriaceae bacterium]
MQIKSFVFNSFYENTYLLIADNKETFIVDPGCYDAHERNELLDFIKAEQLQPKAIVNTHTHIDHVLGNSFLKEHFSIPLWIPNEEAEMYKSVEAYAPTWGINGYRGTDPDWLIPNTGNIQLGELELEIRYAPGHSAGHLIFYHQESNQLIAGDVIFNRSIGRTDLPGGDFATLEQSIKSQVYSLPDETIIYPGHGPKTTVGDEKTMNPFVKG